MRPKYNSFMSSCCLFSFLTSWLIFNFFPLQNFHHAILGNQHPRSNPGKHQLSSPNSLLQHASYSKASKGSRFRICMAWNCVPPSLFGTHFGTNRRSERLAYVCSASCGPFQIFISFLEVSSNRFPFFSVANFHEFFNQIVGNTDDRNDDTPSSLWVLQWRNFLFPIFLFWFRSKIPQM